MSNYLSLLKNTFKIGVSWFLQLLYFMHRKLSLLEKDNMFICQHVFCYKHYSECDFTCWYVSGNPNIDTFISNSDN